MRTMKPLAVPCVAAVHLVRERPDLLQGQELE